jgi:hypothetical protein
VRAWEKVKEKGKGKGTGRQGKGRFTLWSSKSSGCGIESREWHNPYLATPDHIRDPILKWHTRPYPPVDVRRLVAPICIYLYVMGISELYFKSWFDYKKHEIIDRGRFLGVLNPSPNFAWAVRRPGALEAIV